MQFLSDMLENQDSTQKSKHKFYKNVRGMKIRLVVRGLAMFSLHMPDKIILSFITGRANRATKLRLLITFKFHVTLQMTFLFIATPALSAYES